MGLLSSWGAQASPCGGFSCCGAQTLGHVGFSSCKTRALRLGSVIVMHGLCCSKAYRISLDQGSNLCLLYWQADSLPLDDQESPDLNFLSCVCVCTYIIVSKHTHILVPLFLWDGPLDMRFLSGRKAVC